MKDADKNMSRILRRVGGNDFLLMLDFDGVLAPIVARPNMARIGKRTRALLAACARRGRVAVISGRALADVRTRVGLSDIWYAGNHGAEWQMGKARGREKLSRALGTKLREAREAFAELSRGYRGVVVEDKVLTFSVHFRALARPHSARFRKDAERVAKKFAHFLDISEGAEYIFNIRPRAGRTKGDAVRLARKSASAKAVPIYIGDDTTDEDAFLALKGGITIRVGKSASSAAEYYFKTRASVDKFLRNLA
ncbi:MAG: trehalose-phosphatase [Candidatus Kaiserbacteria bacterium]|nr:trehalose-phosphatase [Candidatus Kaiserbacteria bacterium]